MDTPVAFFVFNRPALTARVFAQIAQARPSTLLVVADGPRPGRGDELSCHQVRSIVTQVSWPCKLLTNFSPVNLGCRGRISSGLNWVFDQVERAIILEDDCLPGPDFFTFCASMLDRYAHDERVLHVCGSNYLPAAAHTEASYYFSKYAYIWGWASWRRAWRHYDVTMAAWEGAGFRDERFRDATPIEKRYWLDLWRAVASGEYDTWDVQWVLSCIAAGGLAVVPGVNLVTNIGASDEVTHSQVSALSEQPIGTLAQPLRHPATVARDAAADAATLAHIASASQVPAWRRVARRIAQRLRPS